MPFEKTQRDGKQVLVLHEYDIGPTGLMHHKQDGIVEGSFPGLREVWLSGKLAIRWGQLLPDQPLHIRLTGHTPWLTMYFAIAGHLCVADAGRSTVCASGYHALFMPPAEGLCADVPADNMFQFVSVHWHPDFLATLAETYGEPFRSLTGQSTQANGPAAFVAPHRINAAIQTVLMQVADMNLSGCLLTLFLEAKSMELLTLQLKQFQEQDTGAVSTITTVTDLDKLEEVRRILQREFTCPPTLAALSRAVGLNEFKLKKGFREAFGTSVYDWVLNYRLDIGYRLLAQQMAVSEVAYRIGYQHPAHFTTAFRKKYGIPPSQIRSV